MNTVLILIKRLMKTLIILMQKILTHVDFNNTHEKDTDSCRL